MLETDRPSAGRAGRGLVAVLLAVSLTTAVAVPAPATEVGSVVGGWWRLADGQLALVSNASSATAGEMLGLLAALREAVLELAFGTPTELSVPVTVILFADAGDYRPFRLYQREGQFLATPFESLVVVNAAAERRPARRIAAHEYLHALLGDVGLVLPLWLNEGLAEYYSTATLADAGLVLGAPVPEHRARLRGHPFLDLDELTALTTESARYLEEGYAERFYAQAWLLTHFLISEPEGAARLAELVRRLETGEGTAAAIAASYGYDRRELDRRLREHLNRPRLPIATVPSADPVPPRWTGRALAAEEVAEQLAILAIEQLRWERTAERRTLAEAWVGRAVDPTPLDGDRLALRARLHEALGERDEAAALYARSLYLDARGARTFAYYARFLLDDSADEPGLDDWRREEARLLLDRALESVPGHSRLTALRRTLSASPASGSTSAVPGPVRP